MPASAGRSRPSRSCSLPLTGNLDLRVAARGDDYDDVGRMESWRLGADYRPNDIVALRGSWSAGEKAPSWLYLYSSKLQDHPYIECDPGGGSAPRACAAPNPRQVTRVTGGNPKLDPSGVERLAVGAEARKGPFFLDVEWYRLSRSDLPGQYTADWAMQNRPICSQGATDPADCIERAGGDITIYDSYSNVMETELSGVNARFGGEVRTGWGTLGVGGGWWHIADAELRIAGEKDRYAIPRDAVRIRILAQRGSLSAIWTANSVPAYKNRSGAGTFESWTGHDVALDWADPLGLEGARVTAGVFNLTDAGLSVDTANPSSVDGPTEALGAHLLSHAQHAVLRREGRRATVRIVTDPERLAGKCRFAMELPFEGELENRPDVDGGREPWPVFSRKVSRKRPIGGISRRARRPPTRAPPARADAVVIGAGNVGLPAR